MTMPPDRKADDDVLARAEKALRKTRVPDGPAAEVVAQALAALHAASGRRPPVLPWRGAARWAVRSAAAAIVVVGLLNIAVAWLSRPASAYAAAARKLHDARALAYRTTSQFAGQPASTARVLVKAPALIRTEAEPDGPVTIFDAARNRTLVLDSKSRTALLMEGPAPADGASADLVAKEVDGLRELAEARTEPVGRRRIGAVDAEGFRVFQRGQELTVWVDPRAKVLLRIDLKVRVNDIEMTGYLADFQINPQLDDALFRFEAPAGYALTTGQNAGMSDDEALADLLRTYAEHADGAFPSRLDDWEAYAKRIPRDEQNIATNPRVIRFVQTVTRVQAFLMTRKGEYGYRPERVKLGDADKILLWYRRNGSPGYRAIYGDLHAADVTALQVPEPTGLRPRAD
jgi:outer membrane lipoprotein-sorting protein